MKIRSIIVLGISILLSACSDDTLTKVSRDLVLRHKGADMPIWIRGNLSSGKMILFLHGGPGDCAMCYRYYLKPIEQDYAIAYWDQRVAGSSAGVVDVKTLTYQQFLEDTELVVKLLHEQYPGKKIYLMGHSFGVELGWQFLTKPGNQQQVSGFIAVNGVFSSYRWLHNVREFVLREAELSGNHEAREFATQNVLTPENILDYDWVKLYRYMIDVGGNPLHVLSDKAFVLDYALNSPNLTFAQFTNGKHFTNVTNTDGLTFEKGPLLANVTVPVGLFWGKKDGVVPFPVAMETSVLLTGTTSTIVEFEESWHEPFISESNKFGEEVKGFIGGH
jgi:pimeloyl-ACP methyl ester carboxylesterase